MRALLASLFLFPAFGISAILNSDGSAGDTQTQITAAASGDTVLLPASGSFGWAADVSMPSTKAIKLDLNGSTITMSGAAVKFKINSHATLNNIITNGNWIRGSGFDAFSGSFQIEDTASGAAPRVTHITFSGGDVIVEANGKGASVMDHCVFNGLSSAQEFIHITAYGGVDATGWTLDLTQGGADMLYIEDCVFNGPASGNVAWIQGYYGAKAAYRYNYFHRVAIDAHGSPGAIGQRWWEIYKNQFTNSLTYGFNGRAGSGVCWNNTNYSGTARFGLCEEDSGYPALYQIGRGKNQASDIAYVWGNSNMPLSVDDCDAPEVPGMVAEGRDVTNIVKVGYSPYQYPYFAAGSTPSSDSSQRKLTSRIRLKR